MKILLLSAYLISAGFFQQDATSATSGKKAERNANAQQQPAQNTALSATRPNQHPKQKAKAKQENAASPTNGPAKSGTPKN